jgi:hypothetical protein
MSAPVEKLDQMWWSGYCDESIRFASSAKDPEARIKFLKEHIGGCTDCQTANKVKGLEKAVYVLLEKADWFEQGRDASHLPEYAAALGAVLMEARMMGALDDKEVAWMMERGARHGTPWPGRLD